MITFKQDVTNEGKLQAINKWIEIWEKNPGIYTEQEMIEELKGIMNLPVDYFKKF